LHVRSFHSIYQLRARAGHTNDADGKDKEKRYVELRAHAEVRMDLLNLRADVEARHARRAIRGRVKPGQHADRRRFPRSVWS
jgi:hypothetical protein